MNKNKLNHLAVIMDGNKRWAIKKNKSNVDAYNSGINKLKELCQLCLDEKIKYLTVYALSSENIKRSNIKIIYKIIEKRNIEFLNELSVQNRIKINIIGSINKIPKNTLKIIDKINKKEIKNYGLSLNIGLNYGFKNELIHIFNQLIKYQTDELKENEYHKIKKFSYLKNIPDVDLLIRTGGFQRLSNFILLNLTYSELFFTKTLWPEITKKEILNIFQNYRSLKRNYGL